MVERTAALCALLGAGEGREELTRVLCEAVCARLEGALKQGAVPEDCGEAFPLAAAMTVAQLLERTGGEGGVTAFSVGEVSVKLAQERGLSGAARELLKPWLRVPFAVMEADG